MQFACLDGTLDDSMDLVLKLLLDTEDVAHAC